MKIGVTINEHFKEYLQEIAKVNNLPLTTVCGLILDNFLTYNKTKQRIPLFRPTVMIAFREHKISEVNKIVEDSSDGVSDNEWNRLIFQLESGLPEEVLDDEHL